MNFIRRNLNLLIGFMFFIVLLFSIVKYNLYESEMFYTGLALIGYYWMIEFLYGKYLDDDSKEEK